MTQYCRLCDLPFEVKPETVAALPAVTRDSLATSFLVEPRAIVWPSGEVQFREAPVPASLEVVVLHRACFSRANNHFQGDEKALWRLLRDIPPGPWARHQGPRDTGAYKWAQAAGVVDTITSFTSMEAMRYARLTGENLVKSTVTQGIYHPPSSLAAKQAPECFKCGASCREAGCYALRGMHVCMWCARAAQSSVYPGVLFEHAATTTGTTATTATTATTGTTATKTTTSAAAGVLIKVEALCAGAVRHTPKPDICWHWCTLQSDERKDAEDVKPKRVYLPGARVCELLKKLTPSQAHAACASSIMQHLDLVHCYRPADPVASMLASMPKLCEGLSESDDDDDDMPALEPVSDPEQYTHSPVVPAKPRAALVPATPAPTKDTRGDTRLMWILVSRLLDALPEAERPDWASQWLDLVKRAAPGSPLLTCTLFQWHHCPQSALVPHPAMRRFCSTAVSLCRNPPVAPLGAAPSAAPSPAPSVAPGAASEPETDAYAAWAGFRAFQPSRDAPPRAFWRPTFDVPDSAPKVAKPDAKTRAGRPATPPSTLKKSPYADAVLRPGAGTFVDHPFQQSKRSPMGTALFTSGFMGVGAFHDTRSASQSKVVAATVDSVATSLARDAAARITGPAAGVVVRPWAIVHEPAAKLEAKPDAGKPEAAKPAAKLEAKPEAGKPEAAKPAAKLEAKPEAAKPEAAKPEAAKPEAAKPAAKAVSPRFPFESQALYSGCGPAAQAAATAASRRPVLSIDPQCLASPSGSPGNPVRCMHLCMQDGWGAARHMLGTEVWAAINADGLHKYDTVTCNHFAACQGARYNCDGDSKVFS